MSVIWQPPVLFWPPLSRACRISVSDLDQWTHLKMTVKVIALRSEVLYHYLLQVADRHDSQIWPKRNPAWTHSDRIKESCFNGLLWYPSPFSCWHRPWVLERWHMHVDIIVSGYQIGTYERMNFIYMIVPIWLQVTCISTMPSLHWKHITYL